MLIMRFNRTGKKNRVSYRIVLQEHTTAPGKRHIEILGSHDPHSKNTILKKERIQHWLKEGVQTSDAVYNLLVSEGVLEGAKRAKKIPRPAPAAPAEAPEPAPAAPEAAEEVAGEGEAPKEEVSPETEGTPESQAEASENTEEPATAPEEESKSEAGGEASKE